MGYGADLNGNITSLDHLSPRDATASIQIELSPGVFITREGPTGFSFARSADNAPFIFGFQDSFNPDVIPIYNFGQASGSFLAKGITVGGVFEPASQSWDGELLLAVGAFTGPVGGSSGLGWNPSGPNKAAIVFNSTAATSIRDAEVRFEVLPEPSFSMLGGLTTLALLASRRGHRRHGTCGLLPKSPA
jgi:hypothetical protein